ncbi:MAG: ParB/RepB/Spo0J family partition protein [Dialister sp.]
MSKTRKLGKGLEALFGESSRDKEAEMISVSVIVPNEWQPRREFEEKALQGLADSIKEHGVVQPVIVRPKDGTFELIAGERRLRAAQLAGLSEIPALVREYTDRETAEIALIENLQREDLNPLEEGLAYKENDRRIPVYPGKNGGTGRKKPLLRNQYDPSFGPLR